MLDLNPIKVNFKYLKESEHIEIKNTLTQN